MSYINKVEYSIYSNEEIKSTNIQIKNNGVKDKTDSIYDARLGVNEYICKSCNNSDRYCQGHYGKLYMNYIVPNPAFILNNKIFSDLIKNICIDCNELKSISNLNIDIKNKIDELNIYNKSDKIQLKKIAKEYSINKIPHKCNSSICKHTNKQGILIFDKKTFIFKKKNNNRNIDLEYDDVYKALGSINKKYLYMLGINIDPRYMFFEKFIIIPPLTIRPSNVFYSGDKKHSYNEFSVNLLSLVKIAVNNNGQNKPAVSIFKGLVSIDEGKNKINNNNNTYGNSLRYSGYYKKYIAGKRCDCIGRCVIGPADADIFIGMISVPYAIKKLTKRKYINHISMMNNEIENYSKIAIEYYNSKTKQLINLKNNKSKNILTFNNGDWLTVPLEENDELIFGRQPSLHKFNVLSSKIKFNDCFVFKLPQSIISAQNGDFDGDEEWLFSSLSISSDVEKKLLINARTSPIIGSGFSAFNLLADEIVSLNILSNKKNIPKNQANYILGDLHQVDSDIDGLSLLNIFLNNKLTKQISSDNLGYSRRNTILINEYDYLNNNKAISILDKLSYIAKRHFKIDIFSLDTNSLMINEICQYKEKRQGLLKYLYSKYVDYFIKVENKELIPYTFEYVENKIITLFKNFHLQNITGVKQIFESNKNNLFSTLPNSGTKVTYQDITNILCMGGILEKYKKPTLFNKSNPYQISKIPSYSNFGFIESPMIDGDKWDEYIIKMNDGRNKAVDVVCQTSDAGDISKKLIRKCEDIYVNNYGFLMYNNTLLNQNTYTLKIHENDIRFIEYIFPENVIIHKLFNIDIIKNKLYELHNDGYEYLKRYVKTLTNKIGFYFNINMFISTYYNNNEKIENYENTEDFLMHINKFCNDINVIYYFMLQNLNNIEYVLISYLSQYNDINLTKYILSKIQIKLLSSLSSGENIISNIQEVTGIYVQQALSSFHSTLKSGASTSSGGSNVFKNLLVGNKKNLGKIKIYSKNKAIMEKIQYVFNYKNLITFLPIIDYSEFNEININSAKFKISFIKKYLLNNITLPQLFYMIYYFIVSYKNINNVKLNIDNNNTQYIHFNISISFNQDIDSEYYYKFISDLYSGIYIGKLHNHQYNLEYILVNDIYEFETYIISFNEITTILNVDELNEIYIIPDYIVSSKIYGNAISCFFFENELYTTNNDLGNIFSIDIITQMISKDGYISNISSVKEMSTEKSVQHGKYNKYILSSIKKSKELINDHISRLVYNIPLKLGTNYNNIYIDLNMLNNFELMGNFINKSNKISSNDLKISNYI